MQLGPGLEPLIDLFGGQGEIITDGRLKIQLEPYGIRWFGREK
jgi:hypothetical protein